LYLNDAVTRCAEASENVPLGAVDAAL